MAAAQHGDFLTHHRRQQFDRWIADALNELRQLARYEHPEAQASVLRTTASSLRAARTYADKLNCSARKALCMRVMNWLRADLRRAA